jgi:hypothetical protein
MFGPHLCDFRKDNAADTKLSTELTKVYEELKRWEDVPNRREPYP